MLTSYLVKCPHPGCEFFGSLLPAGDQEAWRNAVPGRSEVRFRCPRCGKDWRARLAGDTPIPLVLPDAAFPGAGKD
jgi:hypothetical protein